MNGMIGAESAGVFSIIYIIDIFRALGALVGIYLPHCIYIINIFSWLEMF